MTSNEVPNLPVAILIELEPSTITQVREFIAWLQRKAASEQKMTVHHKQTAWYNPNHGDVVIYQP